MPALQHINLVASSSSRLQRTLGKKLGATLAHTRPCGGKCKTEKMLDIARKSGGMSAAAAWWLVAQKESVDYVARIFEHFQLLLYTLPQPPPTLVGAW